MEQMYNPEEIINKANDMSAQADNLKKQVERMATIIDDIGSVWNSPAQARFAAKVGEIRTPLLNFCKQINDFATEASTQAKKVISIEAE